jgi:hypothetical protein
LHFIDKMKPKIIGEGKMAGQTCFQVICELPWAPRVTGQQNLVTCKNCLRKLRDKDYPKLRAIAIAAKSYLDADKDNSIYFNHNYFKKYAALKEACDKLEDVHLTRGIGDY